MKKIKTNFSNKTDTGQNQKPKGHKDNTQTSFPVCGLSYYLGKKINFPVMICSSKINMLPGI